jgi:hypothetical protein
MCRALVLSIQEYCGAIWGPDMLTANSLTRYLSTPSREFKALSYEALAGHQLRKTLSRKVCFA